MENTQCNNYHILKVLVSFFETLTRIVIIATIVTTYIEITNLYFFFKDGTHFNLINAGVLLLISAGLAGFTEGLKEGI